MIFGCCIPCPEYLKAVEYYSEALKVYPSPCEHEIAVCHANRAACYVKMVMENDIYH